MIKKEYITVDNLVECKKDKEVEVFDYDWLNDPDLQVKCMGYRSDVRIIMSKNAFKQFKENVLDHVKKYKSELPDGAIAKDYHYDMLKDLDISSNFDDSGEQVYFGWNYVKWYDGYEDVDAIMDSLDKLEEQGYGYNYARIGEEYDDIEEKYVDATEKDGINYIECIDINRSFDDDYMLNRITKDIEPEM